MGKNVLVQAENVSRKDFGGIYQDITNGKQYQAYLPDAGERDKDGLKVLYADELWITEDDTGEHVVGQVSDGFVVVAGV